MGRQGKRPVWQPERPSGPSDVPGQAAEQCRPSEQSPPYTPMYALHDTKGDSLPLPM